MDAWQAAKAKTERRLAKKGIIPVETTEKSEKLHREHCSGDSLHYGWLDSVEPTSLSNIAPHTDNSAISTTNSATTATFPDLGMKDPTLGINGADILQIAPKPMGAVVTIEVELPGNIWRFAFGVPDLMGAIHGFTPEKLKEKLRDALKSQFGQRIK